MSVTHKVLNHHHLHHEWQQLAAIFFSSLTDFAINPKSGGRYLYNNLLKKLSKYIIQKSVS
jgi:hypothetical protein